MIRERALYLECPRISLLAGIMATRSSYGAAVQIFTGQIRSIALKFTSIMRQTPISP